MKKLWCCILAAFTLFTGTAVSCAPAAENSSSVESAPSIEDCTLELKKKSYKIEDEQTVELQVEFTHGGLPADKSLLSFASSDESIATVSADGAVTGVSGGKAYITVSYGELSVKATVTVTMRVYKIELSQENAILQVGESAQVTAKGYFGVTEQPQATLAWQSSNPSVATVENGLIMATGVGQTEITVSYESATAAVLVSVVAEATAENVNSFSEQYVNIYGRSYVASNKLGLDHAANALEVGVIGSSLTVQITATAVSYMRVYVDGVQSDNRMKVTSGSAEYVLADGLEAGYHTVRMVKATEEQNARWYVSDLEAEGFFAVPEKTGLKIEFIGDSITAGYGVLGVSGDVWSVDNSDCTKSYAYIAAQELNANYSIVAWSGICAKAYHWSANLNMDTLYRYVSNTKREVYTFAEPADVVVLNLGTNEASYISGENNGDTTYGEKFPTDYQAFLQKIREKNPDAYIVCLYGMMGRSSVVHVGIQAVIENMNDEKILYNPFAFTENTWGAAKHPNSAGQKKWGEDLAAFIRTLEV